VAGVLEEAMTPAVALRTSARPLLAEGHDRAVIASSRTPASAQLPEDEPSAANAGQRDSLRTALRGERTLWRGSSPRTIGFWSARRVSAGVRGGSIEVRRASSAGVDRPQICPVERLGYVSIDGLFDFLERSADRDAEVRSVSTPAGTFPRTSTPAPCRPDMWAVIEARGLRPM